MCKPGSVGDLGGQPPRSTRPDAPDPDAPNRSDPDAPDPDAPDPDAPKHLSDDTLAGIAKEVPKPR